MGLAPFGEPIHCEDIRSLLELNLHRGVSDFLPHAKEEDLAASVQLVYEQELIKLVESTKSPNLIL